jgi:SPFH domain / Band 7 family
VDSYENFVQVQSESALRTMATPYAYDSHVAGQMSLRSHIQETAAELQKEIQDRLAKAGVQVVEARISHLAYAAEIAGAMLQRQQASAIIAARQTIVEGAVSIVQMALDQLSERKVVELDPERRAAMGSNLLVVLCGERSPQPVVNAGSLYS